MFNLDVLSAWAIGLAPWALAFAVVMVVDFITGALLAWKKGTFDWEQAPRFLQNGALYLWAWIASEILGLMPVALGVQIPTYAEALADWGPKSVLAFVVVGKYVASIVKNIKAIREIDNPEPWGVEPDDKPAG